MVLIFSRFLFFLEIFLCVHIFPFYQDLIYGKILAGRPEAWLVKQNIFLCMQSQNFKQDGRNFRAHWSDWYASYP